MGGEWWFNFRLEKKDSFDLKAYQDLLPKLKAEFEPKFKEAKYDFQVTWCPDDKLPPEDNIFARFTYVCSRNHASWGLDHPVWHLFWDPTIVPKERSDSNIHGKCGPCTGIGNLLQERLVRAFPNHFDHENDYVNEYRCEAEGFYEPHEDDDLDYTACDKDDCGYCGKCPY